MTTRSFLPLVAFDRIEKRDADARLVEWGHWLGACNRPFGQHHFGLFVGAELLGVVVSASTVNESCGGYPRSEIVELARHCSHPDHRDLSRVLLRLWRKIAPVAWAADYWPVRALVSYANAARHTGDLYRFDGWRKVAEVRGGTAGGNWTRGKQYEPKSVWAFDLPIGPGGLTKTAQTRMVGNSVCPPVAEAIVRANVEVDAQREAA